MVISESVKERVPVVAWFALVEWKKVQGGGFMDFSKRKNVGEESIAWNEEGEASPRVGE